MYRPILSDQSSRRHFGPSLGYVIFTALFMGVVLLVHWYREAPKLNPAPLRWPAQLTPDEARAALTQIRRVEPAIEIAYDRVSDFGAPWTDVDQNGCDTRNDILGRDLTSVSRTIPENPCAVSSGVLNDPYTGTTIQFDRHDALTVQIDHLIPLHAAWQLGAWRWSNVRRVAFANDPRELVAVSGVANQDKSDALADRWRPKNHGAWCVYAINSVAVHSDYTLGVTASEASALTQMLALCPK